MPSKCCCCQRPQDLTAWKPWHVILKAWWLVTIAATQQGTRGYVPSSVMLSAHGWFDGKERSGALLNYQSFQNLTA